MTCDSVFRVITIVCFAGVVAVSLLHYLAAGRKVRAAGPSGGRADLRRLGVIERLMLLGFVATFLCLAVSGFAPNLLLGEKLESWLLMLHVAGGGGFLAFLLLLAILWAEDCRFTAHDGQWCRTCCCGGEAGPAGRFDAAQKFTFWASLTLGVAAGLTMMISMLPIFSPEGLDVLRDLHRYCGLLFVLVLYCHVYQTMVVRRGRVRWLVSGKVSSDWARHYHPIWWDVVKGKAAE